MRVSYTEKDLRSIVDPAREEVERIYSKMCRTKIYIDIDFIVLDETFSLIEKTFEEGFPPNTDPNPFKMAGAICYWIKRLHPFRVKNGTSIHATAKFVNEQIAILIGLHLIFGSFSLLKKIPGFSKPNISNRFLKDFWVSLRYYQQSPQSLALVFEALCSQK